MKFDRLLLEDYMQMEGVWYVTADDGFRFDKLRHFTWEQLQKPEAIAELRQAFS